MDCNDPAVMFEEVPVDRNNYMDIELRDGYWIPKSYDDMPALLPLVGLMAFYNVDSHIINDTLGFIGDMDFDSINRVLDDAQLAANIDQDAIAESGHADVPASKDGISKAVISHNTHGSHSNPLNGASQDVDYRIESGDANIVDVVNSETGDKADEKLDAAPEVNVGDREASQSDAGSKDGKQDDVGEVKGSNEEAAMAGEESGTRGTKRSLVGGEEKGVKLVRVAGPMVGVFNRVQAAMKWRKRVRGLQLQRFESEGFDPNAQRGVGDAVESLKLNDADEVVIKVEADTNDESVSSTIILSCDEEVDASLSK